MRGQRWPGARCGPVPGVSAELKGMDIGQVERLPRRGRLGVLPRLFLI